MIFALFHLGGHHFILIFHFPKPGTEALLHLFDPWQSKEQRGNSEATTRFKELGKGLILHRCIT
jgi:hypothetical protein